MFVVTIKTLLGAGPGFKPKATSGWLMLLQYAIIWYLFWLVCPPVFTASLLWISHGQQCLILPTIVSLKGFQSYSLWLCLHPIRTQFLMMKTQVHCISLIICLSGPICSGRFYLTYCFSNENTSCHALSPDGSKPILTYSYHVWGINIQSPDILGYLQCGAP